MAFPLPRIMDVAQGILSTITKKEDEETIVGLSQVHFTCLARASQDTYTSASVVTNFTTEARPLGRVEQFQLNCVSGIWAGSPSSFFEQNLPAMPFDISTSLQCYACEDIGSDEEEMFNYDPNSNCVCKYSHTQTHTHVHTYIYIYIHILFVYSLC